MSLNACDAAVAFRDGQNALEVPPPRGSRFGSPLRLSYVHRVRPELMTEVTFPTWTYDDLLRQAV